MPSNRTRGVTMRGGLTGRGWACLISGAVLAGVGALTGVVPAIQIGVLALAIPVLAAALVRPLSTDVRPIRRLSAYELASGGHLDIELSLAGPAPRGLVLFVVDRAPAELGGPHRTTLTGRGNRAGTPDRRRVRVNARGRHAFGSTQVHLMDPFGLVQRSATHWIDDTVLVHPEVIKLAPLELGRVAMGAGSGHLGARGSAVDDLISRDYQPGDDVRRMDWKASARRGMLMVRNEEGPWRSAVTLVVDLRACAHRGASTDSSLDLALSAVASIGLRALVDGWDLVLRSTDDVELFSGSALSGRHAERAALLSVLATVESSSSLRIDPGLAHLAGSSTGPVLLVLGAADGADLAILDSMARSSPARMVLAVVVENWTPGAPASRPTADRRAISTEAPLLSGTDRTMEQMRATGWRTAPLTRSGGVSAAWQHLAGPR